MFVISSLTICKMFNWSCGTFAMKCHSERSGNDIFSDYNCSSIGHLHPGSLLQKRYVSTEWMLCSSALPVYLFNPYAAFQFIKDFKTVYNKIKDISIG